MSRRLHSLLGLVLALALVVVGATGAVLSVQPTLDRFSGPAVTRGTSVATLAGAVAARHDGVTTIRVRANGVVTAAFDDGTTGGVERVDPTTGAGLGPFVVSDFTRTLVDLHRAFLGGETGRMVAAVVAVAMLGLSISGLTMLARRLGGARALFRPVRGGSRLERWHGELGRLAAIGLTISAATGLWMSASTFGWVNDGGEEPVTVEARGLAPAPIASLRALAGVDVADLRELRFPDPTDRADTFLLTTAEGQTRIDPATGDAVAFRPATVAERIGEVARVLHTGRGAWALGLLLGLSSAAVPFFAVSGVVLWARRRGRRGASVANVPAATADTVILVGSDGGSTRGFAATLATALADHGHRVHVADMNDVDEVHLGAERLLVLAATWGDGAAPASATRFLDRLDRLEGRPAVAVLGFGDRTFPTFCAYARTVSDALEAKGFPRLLETKRIDRRSAQEFAQWGRDLGAVLGHDLVLAHVADRPATVALELVEREDYGAAVGAPVAILRFAAPAKRAGGRRGPLPDFEAGDLLGVVPPGEIVPRFYSLASSKADGIVEICVRLMPGGVSSTRLHGLRPGDRIDAFVRGNPRFRPAADAPSLILIGAGAGIGPLAGFVRANDGARPVHLYWGGRSPASDFLYEHELARHLAERRLTSLTTAFSRDPRGRTLVQDRIAADARRLGELVRQGAQILVCGSRDMSTGVRHSLEAVLRPIGLDLATLSAGGRYVEDVY